MFNKVNIILNYSKKLKLLAKVDEIKNEEKYKKITLKNINILLCNGKD